MNSNQVLTRINDEKLAVYFDRLQTIFADMDQKYDRAAGHYGFLCRGCEENCCRTRFYHHTFIEYLFIRNGFEGLPVPEQSEILAGAKEVCRQVKLADEQGRPVRLMCPLNSDGLCRLYRHRPMICRLHGIPHELRRPAQPAVYGPGCGDFDARCSDKPYVKFDRTPFYLEMAALENEFKQASGLTDRIKMTVAEMILSIGQSAEGMGQSA